MANQVNSRTVVFELGDTGRKIEVPASTSFDNLHQLVASRWNIDGPIELVYLDSATGRKMILDVKDNVASLLSQNFKWKVLAVPASNPSGATQTVPTASSGACTTTAAAANGDSFDESLVPNKDKWMGLIPADWKCETNVQRHPFFISYCQASEKVFAGVLFNEIASALANSYTGNILSEETKMDGRHAFWDAKCLAYGQKWDINFMSGLFHSSVIILLCSDASMKRMQEAHTKPNNCLLEWELALQMKEERGVDILPVLLAGQVSGTLEDGNKELLIKEFSTFDAKFPDLPHAHPLSPRRHNVSDTVRMVLKLNGCDAFPDSDLPKIVTAARRVYSRRKAEQKTPNPSREISLSRSELNGLEKWLTPLSELMDDERKVLLKDVLSGSRQWLLRKVFEFLSPSDPSVTSTSRVMWLKGVAGVGKSVMAAIVSRELEASGMLGGLFFCKHDDERQNSAHNLVLTLVFGLAKFSIHFGEILLQVKQDNPDILSRSVFELMNLLLVEPLKRVVDAKKLNDPVVLVVDALDECSAIGKRVEILAVFQELNRLLPPNVKLLVTGRPEEDISKAFETIPVTEIEPTAEDNITDQIEYMRNFLITLNAEQSVVDDGSKILVSKSSGIFVWLVTACTYLRDSNAEVITLDEINSLPEGDKLNGCIDKMYDRIFAGILDSAKLSQLESLLHTVLSIIVLAYEPLTAAAMVSLLDGRSPGNVKRCIRMLDPILVLDGSSRKIRIFHKSVKDYLTDPSRCGLSVRIELNDGHAQFASLCISALNKNLKFNMCHLPFDEFHTEVPDFNEKVAKGVPEHVRYAVKHFWEHCFDSSRKHSPKIFSVKNQTMSNNLLAELQSFLENHGHHFLEACSLLDSLNLVIPAMAKLQTLLDGSGKKTLETLMTDMKRVLQKFLIPLKASALQVYFTAVPFSPSGSEFHKKFVEKVPHGVPCPRVVKGQPTDWPACMNVLEGHSDFVLSAAFSPDGQFVVSGSADRTVRIWNASTGQEMHKLVGHTDWINSAAFSPDGLFVVSGSDDKTLRIWNASTGQEMHKLEGHSDYVRTAAFSPDGQFVVSGSDDWTVRIWNATTGQEMHNLVGHTNWVRTAAFSPDGQFVVSGSDDKTVRIWNVSTGRAYLSWFKKLTKAHWQLMYKLDGFSFRLSDGFSADGHSVVLRDQNGKAKCIDLATGLQVQENAELSETVSCHQKSSFCVRYVSGKKLQDGQTASASVMNNGVWFSPTTTKVLCWLSPEFRVDQQLLTKHSILLLGSGFSSVIQF